MTLMNQPRLTIEDFNSEKVKVMSVPVNASQTFKGSKMVRQVVDPIQYIGRTGIDPRSIKEFDLNKQEQEEIIGASGNHKFNHINQNKILAANIRQQNFICQSFKKSVLCKSNGQNLEILKKNQIDREQEKRALYLVKLSRWDRFRERKQEHIDRYLKVKRQSRMLESIAKLALGVQVIKDVNMIFKEAVHNHIKKLKMQFLSIKICHVWFRRNRRWGEDEAAIIRNKIPKFFSIFAQYTLDIFKLRAAPLIQQFLHFKAFNKVEQMKTRMRDFYKKMIFL